MVRSERCLRRWYLSVRRLSEWWLSRWTRCKSRLREDSLDLNTLWLEWRKVRLGLSLLIATLRVYSTLHFSNLYLFLNSGMCLSLFSGLCWCSLCFSYLRTIWGLLKFHPPYELIIIRIISAGGLKVCLSAQVTLVFLNTHVRKWP